MSSRSNKQPSRIQSDRFEGGNRDDSRRSSLAKNLPEQTQEESSISTTSSYEFTSSPRSILRLQPSRTRVAPRIAGRRRRLRFSPKNQVFLIPSRKRLREEYRLALRLRRLRRRLVLRHGNYTSTRSTRGKRVTTRGRRRYTIHHRPNRLGTARRRYIRSLRSNSRKAKNLPSQSRNHKVIVQNHGIKDVTSNSENSESDLDERRHHHNRRETRTRRRRLQKFMRPPRNRSRDTD